MKNRRSSSILQNCYILYFILIICTVNLIGCGLLGDYIVPILFLMIALMVYSISKNMTVILTISLVFSNIIKSVLKYHEGMTDKESIVDKTDKSDKIDKIDTMDKPKSYGKEITLPRENNYKQQYDELLALQEKIIGNVNSLEESLTTSEKIVKNIAKQLQ